MVDPRHVGGRRRGAPPFSLANGLGPEAHRFADIADCGSSKAQIGATLTLASGKSRAVDSESTQRPLVPLLAQSGGGTECALSAANGRTRKAKLEASSSAVKINAGRKKGDARGTCHLLEAALDEPTTACGTYGSSREVISSADSFTFTDARASSRW